MRIYEIDHLDSVVRFVNPRCLDARLLPGPARLGETIRAEAFDVGRGTPVEQRFDQQFADAARPGDAVRVATAGHDEALHTATLANDKPAVRCERWPSFADKILVRAFGSGNKSREAFLKTVEHLPIGLDRRWFVAQQKTARVQVQRLWFPAAQQQS